MAVPSSTFSSRKKRNVRARRTLLWCGGALALSPLLGGFLVDRAPLQHRDFGMAQTVSAWQRHDPRPELLLLGSSRLGSFVQTARLEGSVRDLLGQGAPRPFNAALVCGEPNALHFLTRELLEKGEPAPRLALLEISPDLLGRDNPYVEFFITRQLRLADVPGWLPDLLQSTQGLSRLASSRLTPFFRHRSELLGWAAESLGLAEETLTPEAAPTPLDGTDWAANRALLLRRTGTPAQQMERGANRFRAHLRNYELAGRTAAALEETVALLRRHGSEVILFRPPLSSVQRELFTPEILAQFERFVSRLQAEHGCRFVDLSERMPDEAFLDNHHGTEAGAAQFSEILAREVLTPAWREAKTPRSQSAP